MNADLILSILSMTSYLPLLIDFTHALNLARVKINPSK